MRLSSLVVLVALALALGLSAPASAATADPHASCAGLAGASRAGDPGAEAEVVHGVIADATSHGFPPGATFGDFARHHLQTAEVCLD